MVIYSSEKFSQNAKHLGKELLTYEFFWPFYSVFLINIILAFV